MNNLKAVAYNEKLLRKLQDVLLDLTDEDSIVYDAVSSVIKTLALRIIDIKKQENWMDK